MAVSLGGGWERAGLSKKTVGVHSRFTSSDRTTKKKGHSRVRGRTSSSLTPQGGPQPSEGCPGDVRACLGILRSGQ
jgi:hypothetical protein